MDRVNSPQAFNSGSCNMAFKEWSGVCQALRVGRQSIIIRKGGIAEEGGRFTPDHDRFWLFPTITHQQAQGLREPGDTALPGPEISINSFARVELVARLHEVEQARALKAFHIWTDETIENRFYYRHAGLWVLGVRIYLLDDAIKLANQPEFHGCHSWVHLPQSFPLSGLKPAIPEKQYYASVHALKQTLHEYQERGSDE